MAYEQTEAIVLRKVDYGESSSIVTFLTPCRGRMACMARGARRKGSPLLAALDTYNRLEATYTWKDSRQIQNLVEAAVLDRYGVLKDSVERSASAAFILEIASRASCENHSAPELFRALAHGLGVLARPGTEPFAEAAQSACMLLEAAGIMPDLEDEDCLLLTRRFSPEDKVLLGEAMKKALDLQPVLESGSVIVLFDFLHDYVTHHFDYPMKSYAFLKMASRVS